MIRIIRFVVLLTCLAAPLSAQSRTLRVIDTSTAVETVQGGPSVSLAVISALGGRLQVEQSRARVVLFGDTILFFSHSPFFTVNGSARQLAAAAASRDAGFWVPLQFFSDFLPLTYSQRLVYANGALRMADASVAATDSAKARRSQRVVVLDAGHGGKDPGKPGPNGLLEKTVALNVVNRLAAFLRERGYEVHLTRTRDTLISLADRPHLANDWKNGRPAAVFVSLHANSGATSARGFETYFLSEARTDDDRRVAEMENAAVQYEDRRGPTSDLDLIISGLKNDFYLRASDALAELVQSNLAAVHPGPNRGVKPAGFRVLVGALMPAILVEMAFISNPEEARLLGTAAFQEKIAWSLSLAIDRFFETHEAFFATPGQ